jgi:hypothetical protein
VKLRNRLAVVIGVIAIGSAMAVASTPAKPGNGNGPKPFATGPSGAHGKKGKARAYGKRCKGVSKRHIAGEKGTPHSQCVHALKLVAKKGVSPEDACAPLSQASDEAKCVAAGKKLAAGLRP